jgi:hypothetical protein
MLVTQANSAKLALDIEITQSSSHILCSQVVSNKQTIARLLGSNKSIT